jgi:hypothetical protein
LRKKNEKKMSESSRFARVVAGEDPLPRTEARAGVHTLSILEGGGDASKN